MTPNATASRGLEGVVAAQTRLSHVDGQNGVLIVGGYSIEELAGHATFEQVAHLLWRGRLPDKVELKNLSAEMAEFRELQPLTLEILRAATKAPPIDALRMASASLSLGLKDPNAITPEADFGTAMRLTACFPPWSPRTRELRRDSNRSRHARTFRSPRIFFTWFTGANRTPSPHRRSTRIGLR